MHFTREPIIVTVVSPREGCKLVVRNSKAAGQEEYFLDAVEVVSFGPALFFRSVERPKAFLLPVVDYEVLEVRETRVVLKHTLAGDRRGRGAGKESTKAPTKVAAKAPVKESTKVPAKTAAKTAELAAQEEDEKVEERPQRKRERRRTRRRRGRDDRAASAVSEEGEEAGESSGGESLLPGAEEGTAGLSSILPPPPTLISDRYKKVREPRQEAVAEETTEEEPAEKPKHKPGFSPAQLLRRLTGQEDNEEASEAKDKEDES